VNILTGDILDIVSANGGVLVHQVNCRRVAGAGLALQIRRRWPVWWKRYRDRPALLGYAHIAEVDSYIWIADLYAQRDIGRYVVQTDYAALRECLTRLGERVDEWRIDRDLLFFPWRIGCGLAGGNWTAVQPMVEAAFPDANWVQLPGEVQP